MDQKLTCQTGATGRSNSSPTWRFSMSSATLTQTEQPEGRLPYKWIVMIVMVIGTFLSVLDTTVINNALPRLQVAFGANLDTLQWVVTAYTLTQGVITPLTAYFI